MNTKVPEMIAAGEICKVCHVNMSDARGYPQICDECLNIDVGRNVGSHLTRCARCGATRELGKSCPNWCQS